MSEPKTIRMKRKPNYSHQFVSADGLVEINLGDKYRESDELDITITVPKSREERLREARQDALVSAGAVTADGSYCQAPTRTVLDIIERVDAEFAKGEGNGG